MIIKKTYRGGLVDLRKGRPGVDYWHGGGNSSPPGAQASVTPVPCGHTGDSTLYDMK